MIPTALACRGDVTLPPIFSDGMVLQRQAPVTVWGHADAGESVTVRLGSKIATDTAGPDGQWTVKLPGLHAGGPYDLDVSGKNRVTIHNVAMGEVWLCAGASNMAMTVPAARNADTEIANANYPMLRVFTVQSGGSGEWLACSPETVKQFSATAYFFGRELNESLHTPVGLIVSACEATPIEAWVPPSILEKDFPVAMERYRAQKEAYPAAEKAYEEKLAAWKAAQADPGSPAPHVPVPPRDPEGLTAPGKAYESLISPLTRWAIRGVAWYQGEADVGNAAAFAKLFPAAIQGWRAAWHTNDLPFIHAQLAGFLAPRAEPGESRWAEMRETQMKALSTPGTGMAVTIDTGAGIHPVGKQDVGHRLALLAQVLAYGKDGAQACGPVFAGMKIEGGKVKLTFQHAGEGLAKSTDRPLEGFAMAGEDRNFMWADATIQGGNTVVLQSAGVPKPVAVRYAWADSPEANLCNKAGLPAAPFRTDAWGSE